MILFMSNILLRFNKKDIIAERNITFYKVFKKKIRGHLKEIIPQVPDIGNSIFKYVKVDRNQFRLDTYECGLKKLCKRFGVEEMLPSLCRMDYLTAHYLKHSFERTKTLGDGDEVCNNQFSFIGECEWAPEKGFEHRK